MLRRIAYVRARAGVRPPARAGQHARLLASSSPQKDEPQGGTVNVRTGKAFGAALGDEVGDPRENAKKYKGTNFPEFLEHWSRQKFYQFGTVGAAGAGAATAAAVGMGAHVEQALVLDAIVALYWYIGMRDIKQTAKAIPHNFPVLGNIRYLLESIRPEIRQYFIESDQDATPYDRAHRSIVYQRAKNANDTLPLGTRRDVYKEGYEWVGHSLWPKHMDPDKMRCVVGGPECKLPYSASLLNVSAMSYGALSQNAILALNGGAKLGNFYHNTGEGGISRFHKEPGGDIVWNVGTGYFGCRTRDGKFCPDMFKDTAALPQLRMIEIKLSQGAKPGHGGILPQSKLTDLIREARGLEPDFNEDVNSPPNHTAFGKACSLMEFVGQLREDSGGKPIGFKLCVGKPEEFAALARAMVVTGITPDFITVDGGEGGTGAAPPEFSNSVGFPMIEGLNIAHNMLIGAGVRDDVKIICSGRVLSGFSIVRNLAMGADLCNAARAMMFALGCIQALKCNTNKCPTGVATQDLDLMAGLNPEEKMVRVFNYHRNTIHSASELIGAAGHDDPTELTLSDIHRRCAGGDSVTTYEMMYPVLAHKELLDGYTEPDFGESRTPPLALLVGPF